MFGGMLLGAPVILTPIQLLLVNLVTDGLPAIALSVEPGHPDIMEDPPRSRDESIFAGGLWGRMAFRGVLIGIVTLLSFSTFMRVTGDLATARCAALMTLIFSQLFHVIECRSEKRTIFEINPFGNPALLGRCHLGSHSAALRLRASSGCHPRGGPPYLKSAGLLPRGGRRHAGGNGYRRLYRAYVWPQKPPAYCFAHN